jgi:hypothetical protein
VRRRLNEREQSFVRKPNLIVLARLTQEQQLKSYRQLSRELEDILMSNEHDDEAADSQQESEQQPADSDQTIAQSEEQSTEQTDQSTEQPEDQPADTDQATDQAEEQPSDSDQTAEQPQEQPAKGDQAAAQTEEPPSDSDQATTGGSDDTAIFSGETASAAAAGTGVQARPGPRPKRSPTVTKRRFVFRLATQRNSDDNPPAPVVTMLDNGLAGGLLGFQIEEVVSGKTVLVGHEGAAKIPRPTLPAPQDAIKDDPGDLVYHFNSVGMDLNISITITPPDLANEFSNQLEKVITQTDWLDSTEAGLSEPTFFVNGSVFAGYLPVPVTEGETLDDALKARKISRNVIFYVSNPRPSNDAPHTMDYDVLWWGPLSVTSSDRLTPK